MPNLFAGHPDFTSALINGARRIAKAHGCTMRKPSGRGRYGLGAYQLVDQGGNIVAGRNFELTPRDVAKHFGETL